MKHTPILLAALLALPLTGCGLDMVYTAGTLIVRMPLKPLTPPADITSNPAATARAQTQE